MYCEYYYAIVAVLFSVSFPLRSGWKMVFSDLGQWLGKWGPNWESEEEEFGCFGVAWSIYPQSESVEKHTHKEQSYFK